MRLIKRLFRSKKATQARHSHVGAPEGWELKRRFQIDFLKKQGLKPEHYLLDIGCGTLRGGIPMIDYLDRGHYYGIEVRDFVLDEGRKELSDAGLQYKEPELIVCENLDQFDPLVRFDYIWAYAVLIHMKDEIADSCFRTVARLLKREGLFFGNINTEPTPDGEWKGFPIVKRPVAFYESLAGRYGLKVENLGPVRKLGKLPDKEGEEERMKFRLMLKVTHT